MGPGSEAKYLEHAGYLAAVAAPPMVLPGGLRLASRIIPPLSLGLLVAVILGALAFYGHARLGDDRIEAERHAAVRAGVEKFLAKESDVEVDASSLRLLGQFSGARNLKWETGPEQPGREVQSILDGNGRILGWLSWDAERPMTTAAMRFLPMLLAIVAGLLGLAGLSMWHLREVSREFEAAEARVRSVATEDALTGLPNGVRVLQILEQELAAREPNEVVTCCYLDLFGFRELSDSHGRPWTSELVRAAAVRLTDPLPPRATLGRLGRHRFVLVVSAETLDVGLRAAQEMVKRILSPLTVQGQAVQINANVGIAHAPRDGLSSDELFRHATLALRAAKGVGRDVIAAFEPSMEADLQERRFMERELKRALDEDALELHYQPIVTAEGSRIIGIEALLRWNHPVRGNIPPKAFVPLAEQTGMMGRLGEYVLYRALNDAKRWPNLFIAINLSPIQVKGRALFALVSSMLAETGIDPSRLVLEITEGMLMDDPEEMRKRLEELRALGIRIALDDFGSGYSSLSYLQRFPFDKLKIDGSFVASLGKSENSGFIIQAIVALGRALNLSVLVEGVETEEQRVLLRLAGCDEMQGFLFARPAPRQAIDAMLLEAKLEAARGAAGKANAS